MVKIHVFFQPGKKIITGIVMANAYQTILLAMVNVLMIEPSVTIHVFPISIHGTGTVMVNVKQNQLLVMEPALMATLFVDPSVLAAFSLVSFGTAMGHVFQPAVYVVNNAPQTGQDVEMNA